MNNEVFEHGSFVIKDKILKIKNLTINLANLDNLYTFEYNRHSLFANVKDWLIGLVAIFIVCCIWRKVDFLFTIYLFTIFFLFYYNFKEHQKRYYGIKIQTNLSGVELKSPNKEFINDVKRVIENSINDKKTNYEVNLDNCVINNGVISKGNKNNNQVNLHK